jgi:F420-dependent oxidoreductase-like protein
MKIGLQIPRFTWPGGTSAIPAKLMEIAQKAEEGGFHSLWVMDHFFQIPGVGEAEEPMLEGYTTLGFLAGITSRLRLGTLVTGVIYRHPGLLVKQVTTLDVLSGGRAYFGIGAAWFEREAKGLGVEFPPVAERFERLEETLQITDQMWSEEVGPYQGRHYQLEETLCQPAPLTKPHPPIMIGGMGEKKTLKLVAKYADACNLFARAGNEVLKHKLDVLADHCQAVDRDYGAIEKTTLATAHLAPGEMSPQQVVDWCGELADLGVEHAIFNMPNVHEVDPVEQFAQEVIPKAAEL